MALTGTSLALTGNNTTNASFRLWGNAISSNLAATGIVQTADSGQINWGTVVAPTGVANSVGYEIWRFADALQASVPVFFKLEYGSGSAAANPGVWLTVGSGSDNVGGLTGVTTVRQSINATGTVGNTTSYVCGDTGRCVFAMFVAGANAAAATCMVFMLERTVDAAGAATNEGVQIIMRGSSAWNQVAWNCKTGPMSAVEVTLGAFGPSVGTGSSGANTSVYPLFLTKGIFLNPGYNMFGCYESNFTAGVTTSFSVYGVSHTYMPLTSTNAGAPLARGATGSAVMVRYD